MSNNCIYSNNYVYQIEHIHTGRYYIGVRSTNLLPEDDLGKKYFSSSRDKEFIKDQKESNHHYKYKVLKNFDNRDDADNYEMRLHGEKQVHLDPNSYNRAMNSSSGFSTVGKVPARDKDGNVLHVSVDDPRFSTGELVYMTKGMIWVYDNSGKRHIINEGEYNPDIFFRLDRCHVKCKDNNGAIFSLHRGNSKIKNGEVQVAYFATDDKDTYLVFSDDPRILDGTLTFMDINKKIYVYDDNDMRHNIYEDNYDPSIFFKLKENHKRCKDKDGNIFELYITNSRIKNNEVQVAKLATDGNDKYLIFPDDSRILNGELEFIKNNKKIYVYDTSDKRHKIDEDEYIISSDKFYRLPTDNKRCKDIDGNILFLYDGHPKIKSDDVQVAKYATDGEDTYLVFPDDNRILNDKLKFIKKKKSKSMITVYDDDNKRHIINKDDYNSTKFYRLPSHHKRCKDAEGNILILHKSHKKIKNNEVQVAKLAVSGKDTYLVFPDDPRILNGELKFK